MKSSTPLTRLFMGVEAAPVAPEDAQKLDWARVATYTAIHLACLGVIWVGWSWTAVGVAALLYCIRMFAITAFYHRYFSHRSFKTSRVAQFLFGLLGTTALQRGPLWWAAHHRHHHVHSDTEEDLHSPVKYGFWRSQVGWFLSQGAFATRWRLIPDLTRYPELRLLNRFELLGPFLLAIGMYALGAYLAVAAPELGTTGWQMLIWGFFISTVVVSHATFLVNSLTHIFGRKRYATKDDSRNSFWIAIVTFGEGWHNNHHHYPASVRQGFFWWEIDFSYYGLVFFSWIGLIWDLKPVPSRVLEEAKQKPAEEAPPVPCPTPS